MWVAQLPGQVRHCWWSSLGPVIPPARDATKIAAVVTKATGFPSLLLITGSKEMRYLPTRDNLETFLSSLIPYTATFDPALAGLIREVANTHAHDITVIQRWEDALGFAGMSLLFTILVSKCNMSLDLLNYFPKGTLTASNGLSILQILCAATLRYTLGHVRAEIPSTRCLFYRPQPQGLPYRP